jgi:hypothetical protein
MAAYHRPKVVNCDESACNNKTVARKRGWAPAGKRANVSSVFVRGKRYTIEMGISSTGLVAYKLYEGSMDGEDFIT